MSAKRRRSTKKSAPLFPNSQRLIGLVWGPGRPVALGVLIVALFAGGWLVVWREVRPQVLSSEAYWVSSANVRITPLPEWIHTDVRGEVFRDASLDPPLGLLEEDLAERIAEAFSLHPWIAKVLRVTKHHPAAVRVELVYRRPVCMVLVPGGLYPVDGQGVLLPTADFSPIEASRYPRLIGVETVPVGPAGTRWGDVRVVGAAGIAETFGPAWYELKLERIVPSSSAKLGPREEYTYELFTRAGTRVNWGRAPGAEMPSETPAVDKVARLKEYAAGHDSLDGPHGPRQLDVRKPGALETSAQTAGKPKAPAR